MRAGSLLCLSLVGLFAAVTAQDNLFDFMLFNQMTGGNGFGNLFGNNNRQRQPSPSFPTYPVYQPNSRPQKQNAAAMKSSTGTKEASGPAKTPSYTSPLIAAASNRQRQAPRSASNPLSSGGGMGNLFSYMAIDGNLQDAILCGSYPASLQRMCMFERMGIL